MGIVAKKTHIKYRNLGRRPLGIESCPSKPFIIYIVLICVRPGAINLICHFDEVIGMLVSKIQINWALSIYFTHFGHTKKYMEKELSFLINTNI